MTVEEITFKKKNLVRLDGEERQVFLCENIMLQQISKCGRKRKDCTVHIKSSE